MGQMRPLRSFVGPRLFGLGLLRLERVLGGQSVADVAISRMPVAPKRFSLELLAFVPNCRFSDLSD